MLYKRVAGGTWDTETDSVRLFRSGIIDACFVPDIEAFYVLSYSGANSVALSKHQLINAEYKETYKDVLELNSGARTKVL